MSHQTHDKFTRANNGGKGISLVVVVMLIFSALLAFQFSPTVVAASIRPYSLKAQSIPLSQSLTLAMGYYQNYTINSFSNNTSLSYAASSDAPISTALMTVSQFNLFVNNPNDPISNSITYLNGTSVQNNVTIAPGQYFLVFYAYYSSANIQFGYQISPSIPFSYGHLTTPLASGISTFGISNSSGTLTSYEIRTNQLVGVANISSFQVNTPTAAQYGAAVSGATLQLNAVLVVSDSGSSSQKVYWVQNVPDFVTGTSQVSFGDEIWNWTDQSGFSSNQTVTSTNFKNGGFVSPTGPGNSPYVYNYNGPNSTYILPLNFALMESVTVIPKTGVLVQLGYMLIANGSATASKINWFDNITIIDPSVQAAYFDVSGKSTTPIGLYYDAELVFAGQGNLEVAHFTQLNASLGLFYQSSTSANGTITSFPTYYSFSGDTGESADNLVVTYSHGIANIGTGVNPNYSYLGNSTFTTNLQSVTSSTTSPTQTTSSTNSARSQASITTTTSIQSTIASSPSPNPNLSPGTGSVSGSTTAASNSSFSSSNSNSSITMTKATSNGGTPGLEWIAVGVVVSIIMASLVFLAFRRRPLPSQPV